MLKYGIILKSYYVKYLNLLIIAKAKNINERVFKSYV